MSFKLPSLVVILLAAVEIAPLSWARIFLAGRNYPSGEYPIAAVVQDFNNDGVSDIVSANGNDQNISVFLGNPDGTFGPANTFSVGVGAAEVASADLSGDGNADLVVTDDIQSAYVVLGNGDGTFGSRSTISLHGSPLGIAIADLNGDGILDLAIALFGPFRPPGGKVAILIGVGDGSFASPVFYDLTPHQAVRLVAIDLNHDGKLDLAVAVQRGNGLAVLLGNGDGTFQPAVFSQPGDSNDIAAADFNGDGNVDLALVARFDTQVRVVLGNGDGTFQPATTYSSEEVEFTVATADLSRDGVPDLVIGGGDHVSILLGNGDGTFGAPARYGVGQRFARIGYFNADRDPDVVAGGGFSAIGVAFGSGDGTLRAPLAFDGGLTGFDSGDFDGDGHADIVDGAPLSFLRGLGDGTFASGVPIADLTVGQLVATDLNGDGKLDFLASSGTGIDTFLGNGDGTFQAPQFTDVGFIGPWPVVADFNSDGHMDVALTGVGDAQLAILLGKGDGGFEPPIYYQTADAPQSPIAADFNLDGNLDLAISHTFDGTVSIYAGHGDGTFDLPLTITSRGAVYLAAGDVNRDSKPDLVVGGGNGLNLFLGNGDGTFQAAQSIYSRYGPVKVADLDRDGRLDVAVSPGETIVVLRGRGDGTFSSRMQFPVGSQFSGFFVLSDLNGDRTPEAIVSTGAYTSSLTVLLNTSRPRR
jgi:VCBS repeat protein